MSREGPKEPAITAITKSVTINNLEVNNTSSRNLETVKADVKLHGGKWFYEVTIRAYGMAQIGWANDDFKCATASDGVGDDKNSWAYDGNRIFKWHGGESISYGEEWTNGDVIGVAIDLTNKTMHFYKNGKDFGTAYTGFTVGKGLYPALSLAARMKVQVNFGKNGHAHPIPGYLPLYSFITEEERLKLVSVFNKYKDMDVPLRQSQGIDAIKGKGTLQFGEDVGVTEVDDPTLLVMAFKLGAKTTWEFTYDDFVGGFSQYPKSGSIEGIKKLITDWKTEMFAPVPPKDFKAFYNFAFDYLKEEKKILLIEEAVLVWGMLLKSRWPLLDKWLQFLSETPSMKSVSKDTWQQLYEFSLQNKENVNNYDPNSSWPVAIDEFVEWSNAQNKK